MWCVESVICSLIVLVDTSTSQRISKKEIIEMEVSSFADLLRSDKAMNSRAGLSSVSEFKVLCDSVDHTMRVLNERSRFLEE